jgi:heat shock protein HslJ
MVREDCFTNPRFNPDAHYTLAGTWELNFIQDTTIILDSLYHGRKPSLLFTYGENDIFSGHTGCNSMRGYYHAEKNSFKFREPIAMTKMACEGEGEKTYLILLKKVNRYAVNDSSLTLFRDDEPLVRFSKK